MQFRSSLLLSLLAISAPAFASVLPGHSNLDLAARSEADSNARNRRESGSVNLGALSRRLLGTNLDLASRELAIDEDALVLRDSSTHPVARSTPMGRISWQVVKIITNVIHKEVDEGKAHRTDFVDKFVKTAQYEFPDYNWVIVRDATEHSTNLKGRQSFDWGYVHTEFDVEAGKVLPYTVYWFREGEVKLGGYGGTDWAYAGNMKHRSDDGKLTFEKP